MSYQGYDDDSVWYLEGADILNSLDLDYVRPFSEDMSQKFLKILAQEIEQSDNVSVKAAHFYIRKNAYAVDGIGEYRNDSYGSHGDPVAVEIRFEINQETPRKRELLEEMSKSVQEEELTAEKKRHQEALARAEAEMKKAEALLKLAEENLRRLQ